MSPDHDQTAKARSFINVFAWSCIGLSAISVLMSLMQNVMINIVLTPELFQEALQALSGDDQTVPMLLKIAFEYLRTLMLIGLLLAIAMLVVSIALLQRKDWARIVIIVALAVGVLFNIAGAFVPHTVYSMVMDSMQAQPGMDEVAAQLQDLLMAMTAIAVLAAIALCVLHLWLIKRLCSPAVRQEFRPQA